MSDDLQAAFAWLLRPLLAGRTLPGHWERVPRHLANIWTDLGSVTCIPECRLFRPPVKWDLRSGDLFAVSASGDIFRYSSPEGYDGECLPQHPGPGALLRIWLLLLLISLLFFDSCDVGVLPKHLVNQVPGSVCKGSGVLAELSSLRVVLVAEARTL